MGIFVVAAAVLAMTCASVLNWAGAALCVAVLVALAAGTAARDARGAR